QDLIQYIAKVGSSRSWCSSGLRGLIGARRRIGLLLSLISAGCGRALLLSRILLLTLIVTNCGVLLRLILLVLLLLFSADRIQNAADSTLGLSVRRLASSAALIFLTENGAQNSGGQLGWILCLGQHVIKITLRTLLNVGRNMRMLERSGNDHRHH